MIVVMESGVARRPGQADKPAHHCETDCERVIPGCLEGVLKIQPVDTNLLQLALDLAADLRLKGADAIYVALAHQLGVPLVSWDKEQLQRSSGLIEAYTPGNYPF